jgi:hypothetical protein
MGEEVPHSLNFMSLRCRENGFFCISSEIAKCDVVFWVFYYKKFIFTGREDHICNQHKKLHPITSISSNNIFRQNPSCRGLQEKINWKIAEGVYRTNFDEKYFSIKYKLCGAYFCIDSKYDVLFRRKSIFYSRKLKIRPYV